jgi:GNAT superfamily N-acetyltransferase
MATPLRIRRAQRADGALILTMVRELADYEKLAHEVVATETDVAAALFGPNANTYCEIAEWDGEPAGQALWFNNFSTFRGCNGLYLEDLYVRPAFRGRGIGRTLLARLADLCVENGWPRMDWAVLDWNQTAIDFYHAQGAEVAPDWRLVRLEGAALAALAKSG